ncbi:DUF2303 family protein [Vibrio salinus]|uniref:DUF2303 family protein n=1 Tax=Vibrio salinus TaxID=2899784 RepID=UPI001E4B9072|nr:DUF2303 family protein [Vibrio salinus]MCE0495742.1 YfdQ family protein [Vibrio salinus]
MDKSAIMQIQETANIPELLKQLETAKFPVAVFPKDFYVESLEQFMPERNQFRGWMKTANIDEFIRYNEKYAQPGNECFIDASKMTGRTIFDLGTKENPGHCYHKASLALKATAAFNALTAINEERCGQKQLAEWIEDYAVFLEVFAVDGSKIEIPIASAAVRNMNFEARAGRESSVDDFSQRQSEYESIAVRTKDELPMPAVFKFKCEPYLGLPERVFEMRMSTIGNETLILRIKNLEQHQEEMGVQFMDILTGKFKEEEIDVATFIGSFSE